MVHTHTTLSRTLHQDGREQSKRHVDAVRIPILLIHGKDDTVVPYDQSDDMYDALRHAHKQVELVKLKEEDHWLSRSATRLQMLQATVRFLRANNPPD